MKELSIEEKAKLYDKAIEKLHEIITMDNKPVNPKEIGEYLFPELAESEDEKIRKELINAFKEATDSLYMVLTPSKRESFIAWLEKQGEPKPDIIIPKFRVGDTIRIKNSDAEYTITDILNGCYRGKGWCLDIEAPEGMYKI